MSGLPTGRAGDVRRAYDGVLPPADRADRQEGAGSAVRPMRVALLAEGCYPFVTGGVSTWCDQLVRGLAEHEFDVIAVTGGTADRPLYEMPANVTSVQCVPLWGWSPGHRRLGAATRVVFLDLYRPFLYAALFEQAPQEDFTEALMAIFDFAQQRDLTAALQNDAAISLLCEVWNDVHPDSALSMRDAVEATELIEHFLRPLSATVVEADLCHAVSNGIPALLALAAKWTYGTPFLMSEHGVYLRERYLAFRTNPYSWAVKAIMLSIFRRLCSTGYAAADAIVPVNIYNQRWETRHGADPDSIATTFNGVLAADYPAPSEEPEVPTIGWVGRIDPLKDLETLVRAFAIVRSHRPDTILRLFGPMPVGNEWYDERVRALVVELGLTESVTFEGPIRPVIAAYHASTIVALTSISEGLPYTVMEAMMCARATVSTDVGGVPEVAGAAGLVVPPRDPEAFAAACERLLADDDARHALAAAARVRALDLFQIEQMLQTYRATYRTLGAVARRPRSRVPAAAGQQ